MLFRLYPAPYRNLVTFSQATLCLVKKRTWNTKARTRTHVNTHTHADRSHILLGNHLVNWAVTQLQVKESKHNWGQHQSISLIETSLVTQLQGTESKDNRRQHHSISHLKTNSALWSRGLCWICFEKYSAIYLLARVHAQTRTHTLFPE